MAAQDDVSPELTVEHLAEAMYQFAFVVVQLMEEPAQITTPQKRKV